MLTRMKVAKGDTLHAVETAEGYLLTPYDPAVEEQLQAGRAVMKAYRETFKGLAGTNSSEALTRTGEQ